MNIIPVAALSDNYMYLIVDKLSKTCAAVDAVEPEKLLQVVDREKLTLIAALTTHHHWDHAGGNKKLSSLVANIPFYGGDSRIDALTNKITEGDEFKIASLNVKCYFTPCHTSGHICYYVTGGEGDCPAVFTGDTLFIAGCGRFFEGTADQMYHALVGTLAKLPPSTKVYCGHEYTVQNLKFAKHVEANNADIAKKLEWAEKQRANNLPTIPSTIAEELLTNPFMRVGDKNLQQHAAASDPITTMKNIRLEKDNFKA